MIRSTRRRTKVLIAASAALALTVAGLVVTAAQAEATEHIVNGTFDSGTDPWWATANTPISVVNGQLCAQVPGGTTNIWDASIGQNSVPLVSGAAYTLKFSASATVAVTVNANVQLNEAPYTTALSRATALTATPQEFSYTFTGNLDSTNGALTFQLGAVAEPYTFCLDNVSLTSEAGSSEPSGPEQVKNGDFTDGTASWFSYGTTSSSVVDGRLCSVVPAGLANPWDAGVGQNDVPLVAGSSYTFSFEASADPATSIKAAVQLAVDPYTSSTYQTVALTAEVKKFSYTFTATTDTAQGQVVFQLGGAAAQYTLCLDKVSLVGGKSSAPEQVKNGNFNNGDGGWFSYGTTSGGVTDGKMCTVVPAGLANPWDAGLGQNDIPLVAGSDYTFSFEASADPPASIKAAVQLGVDPYTASTYQTVALTAQAQKFSYTFSGASDTKQGQVIFQLGGAASQYTFCVDNVSLLGGVAKEPYKPDTGPRVRVNQIGYLPNGPKNATVVTDKTDPLAWDLKNGAGTVVASGAAKPRGVDAASGQNVQTVDFSSYKTVGTGYTLVADGETSFPFDISGDVWKQLRSDSLQFFYIQRSGIAIDGSLVGAQYARPAGHLGVAPNTGDTNVPCQAGVCDYSLDVRGGWYDAGDQGKYVVNGGIATYQLLNAYERTKTAPTASFGTGLADSTLRVPERGNKVPDILDEARWELEFLLRMQVPAGQSLAGMVHHKIADKNWTGLPMQPQDDPQLRELHPPTTAATLNLAAVAAQCGRLYGLYDAAFAARCLTAAKTAYDAAKAHPAIYASEADSNGSGTYGDTNLTDEFYWAAAELYLTTGDQKYLADVQASPLNASNVFSATGFSWGGVEALARLDLATVPSGLTSAERKAARDSVVAAADTYLATLQAEAYGLPMPATGYFWGANSNIINNVVVLATAYDLTSNVKYRDGALQGMDYIFGRNALNHSYVTGWGEHSSQNQHTRIYAHQLDPALPNPPPGSISGGANASLDDPFAKNLLSGCKPQFCFVDDIQSYATNEIAINWNSALAWAASFMADQGAGQPVKTATCKVTYDNWGWYGGKGFTGQVNITNTGTKAIANWTVQFAFAGDQKVREAWSAKVTQSGAVVTAKNESFNASIPPGGTVMFGFNVDMSGTVANPTPGLFMINGGVCS